MPFLGNRLSEGAFQRSDVAFSFPYGLKHGTILPVNDEEYLRMLNHDWETAPDLR